MKDDEYRRIRLCNERADAGDYAFQKSQKLWEYLIKFDVDETEKLIGTRPMRDIETYRDDYDGKISVRQGCEMMIRNLAHTEVYWYAHQFSRRTLEMETYYSLLNNPVRKIASQLIRRTSDRFYRELVHSFSQYSEKSVLDEPLNEDSRNNLCYVRERIKNDIHSKVFRDLLKNT
jgi:hypothetical protein